ncbi:MAG: hypothetical protein J2P18_05295 [Nocardia sp.]|nr:hypothetical protein [Nocardia sp.]
MPLLTIRLRAAATMAAALTELRLTEDEVDLEYGLIAVDPDQDLYALRVNESAAAKVASDASSAAEVFADPRITTATEPTPPDQRPGTEG